MSDLRQAAEREFDAVSRLSAWLRDYGDQKQKPFVEDLAIVLEMARKQLADPTDDEEPVTASWLDSLKELRSNGHSVWSTVSCFQVVDMCQRSGDHKIVPRLRADRYVIKWEPTRGDVRRLCRSLGIEVTK